MAIINTRLDRPPVQHTAIGPPVAWTPGRGLPDNQHYSATPMTMSTGGNHPVSVQPGTGGTPSLPAFSLPSLDGTPYVATPGLGQGQPQSPAALVSGVAGQFANNQPNAQQTVQQLAQQFAYQPGATPISVAQQIAQAFNTQPDQLPIEIVQQIQAAFAGPNLPSASNVAQGAMDDLLGQEGAYIGNARRRGLEGANARGMLNSSIASGASERAAIEASMPIFNQIMGLNSQREGQDFQGRQNAINQAFGLTATREGQQFQRDMQNIQNAQGLTEMDRMAAIQEAQQRFAAATTLTGQDRQNAFTAQQNLINQTLGITGDRENRAFVGEQNQLDRTQGVNNALLGATLAERRALLDSQLGKEQSILDTQLRQVLQSDSAAQQEWLNSQNFSRDFNGALSMMPIQSAFALNNMIQQYALENPEVYTPAVISGMSNFFNQNMASILRQYFPNMVGGA